MTPHHLINEINQIQTCPYCKNDLIDHIWDSTFDINHHYKETLCNQCHKTIIIKIDSYGSGHDCLNPKSEFCKAIGVPSITSLEEKLKEN